MVRIFIQLLQILFKWLEFEFQWLKSLSNCSNLHSIALNVVRMLPICIRMVRITFEWFECAFGCFESRSCGSNLLSKCMLESLSHGSNFNSSALNPDQMLRICIRMPRIPFEWFEFAFNCFESRLNALSLHSNG